MALTIIMLIPLSECIVPFMRYTAHSVNRVAQKVIQGVYQGVTTSELDVKFLLIMYHTHAHDDYTESGG